MAGFTDYLEEALLNHVFHGLAYAQPTIHVGLIETLPVDDTGLALVTDETSGTDYERKPVTSWTITTDLGISFAQNDNVVDFGPAGAGGWGVVAGFGIWDAAPVETGNLLMYGEFSFPITVAANSAVTFQPGDLKINLA